MPTLLLNSAQQRRLKKLAREAGRTPEQTLRFVLRDGFDFCEWEVRGSLAAESDAMRNGTIPNDEVQRQVSTLIESAHARRRKQAA
jgi:predicted transcriptional regulator